ncbi:DUF5123 domain-containing protein [Olivibacter sitiensis]|uniref:DUF5123 domain-containing protein n=1 Tax=Olivibacter sitiensis TaxID=376470 RepID=UPI000425BB5B|nr:DUF5123 domain-containing protein [Olivibacter sitiensis]
MRNNYILILTAFVGMMSSCKNDLDHAFNPDRLFMPSGTISATSGELEALLTWGRALNTVDDTYEVQVSIDSLFVDEGDIHLTRSTDTTGIRFTGEDIVVGQYYYARVRTEGNNQSASSNWLHSSRFRVIGEQYFLPINMATDVTPGSVLLRWRTSTSLTTIKAEKRNANGTYEEVTTYNLTQEDLAEESYRFTELDAATTYRFTIFEDQLQKGQLEVTTREALDGTIIDLTTFLDRPNVLRDTLIDPSLPAGSIIKLKRGVTYDIGSTVNLTKSVTIMSDDEDFSEGKAIISISGQLVLGNGSSVAFVRMEDVEVVGNGGNTTSNYLFYMQYASQLDELTLTNIDIRGFRGGVRLANVAATLAELSVEAARVSEISDFSFVRVQGTSARIDKMRIANSTFYRMERFIQNQGSAATSVVIESNTIYAAPSGSNVLMDFNSVVSTEGYTIRDNIFGPHYAAGTASQMIRVNGGAISASNNYATSDFVAGSNPLSGLIIYGRASNELFSNPANGDFTIIDQAFPGRNTAGDPRWRQ